MIDWGTHVGGTAAVKDVPRKGAELHCEHHLGTGDLDGLIAEVVNGADSVAIGYENVSCTLQRVEGELFLT
jgi:hypothetical protein